MNFFKIIEAIEKTDPEVYERLDSRRAMFKNMAGFSTKVAVAAAPIAVASVFKKAYGRGAAADSVVDVLNYALTLEYLESSFYNEGVDSGVIPANRLAIFNQIKKHENAHVTFLVNTIKSLSGTPVSEPDFDFTAGGAYSTVFSDYNVFLTLSQAFEDTGVRAYKGRAGELISNDAVLTAALQIHSVEARHASMVRRLRAEKGWITGATGSPSASYAGEDNKTQATIDITTLGAGYSVNTATEAFDEPLTKEQVLAIVTPFIQS